MGTLRHVRDTLAEAGYAPLVTGDPGELSRILRTEKPRLVLLDLMLPGTDGIQLMQTGAGTRRPPRHLHLGLRARRDHRAGAGGRRRRLHRQALFADRPHGADRGGPAPAGGARPIRARGPGHRLRRRVTVAGRRVELTATEYELLRVLAQDAGRVLTHETLLRRVWAGRPAAAPKIVRAYVKRLRDKLADEADRPALIVNERGVGYRMPRPGDR